MNSNRPYVKFRESDLCRQEFFEIWQLYNEDAGHEPLPHRCRILSKEPTQKLQYGSFQFPALRFRV